MHKSKSLSTTDFSKDPFFPNASEILDVYREIYDTNKRLQAMDQRNRLLEGVTENCPLCNNSGFAEYKRNGHATVARCVCPYGSDPTKFGEAQLNRDYIPDISRITFGRSKQEDRRKAMLKAGKNPFYWPDVREALGDEFPLYEAEKKERRVSSRHLTSEEKTKILRGLQKAYEIGKRNS